MTKQWKNGPEREQWKMDVEESRVEEVVLVVFSCVSIGGSRESFSLFY